MILSKIFVLDDFQLNLDNTLACSFFWVIGWHGLLAFNDRLIADIHSNCTRSLCWFCIYFFDFEEAEFKLGDIFYLLVFRWPLESSRLPMTCFGKMENHSRLLVVTCIIFGFFQRCSYSKSISNEHCIILFVCNVSMHKLF